LSFWNLAASPESLAILSSAFAHNPAASAARPAKPESNRGAPHFRGWRRCPIQTAVQELPRNPQGHIGDHNHVVRTRQFSHDGLGGARPASLLAREADAERFDWLMGEQVGLASQLLFKSR
jgi:hypothetical protein